MEFVILTGMSGAGKSVASDTLEDLGYLCIDNMPVSLIPKFADMYAKEPNKNNKVAFIIDVRGEIEFESLISELSSLKASGNKCITLFVDCENTVLINRYKETRRIHPLVAIKNLSMKDAIELERKMLYPIREYADYVIDTSRLTVRQFRDKLLAIRSNEKESSLVITCMSFGFKNGIVTDADLVFDVRCFPNPFYVENLKHKTGLDSDVKEYVFAGGETLGFIERLNGVLDYLIPLYIKEGKSHLTIAFGCTGGKHRSVAISETVGANLSSKYKTVIVHRDIGI